MKLNISRQIFVSWLIAVVWLANGLLCKVLNFVPRHRAIVGVILGYAHSALFTTLIGIGEILVAAWIISRIKPKLCAAFQIVLIGIMNTMEFFLVPQLLLWGRLNLVFAIVFMIVIYSNEFIKREKQI